MRLKAKPMAAGGDPLAADFFVVALAVRDSTVNKTSGAPSFVRLHKGWETATLCLHGQQPGRKCSNYETL
jgi:hypothetical protein